MFAHDFASEDGLKVLGAAVPQLQHYSLCVVIVRLEAAVSVPLPLSHEQVVVVWCCFGIQGRSS